MKNEKGFTFVEVMMAAGFTAVLSLSTMVVLARALEHQYVAMSVMHIEQIKQEMIRSLSDGKAWSKTIRFSSNVSSMTCLEPEASSRICTNDGTNLGEPIQDRPFILLDAGGNVIVDATNPSNGFTSQGANCSTFSVDGNDQCPFRFNLVWSAVCVVGECESPQIKVKADLLYTPGPGRKRTVFNVERHSIAAFYLSDPLVAMSPPPPSPPSADISSGCDKYIVPPGVTRLKVLAIGGGGGGSRSTPGCAYRHLSGAGGASVEAIVNVTPGEEIPYCIGAGGRAASGSGYTTKPNTCGSHKGKSGGTTYFGTYIVAKGGEYGQAWHYKNADGRGTPASKGGSYTTGAGVEIIGAQAGTSVKSLGACGGKAGLGMGAGACKGSTPGANYGGGGFGGDQYHYRMGPLASDGGPGRLLIEPL